MRNAIVGIVIGVVVGIAIGTTVIAPRLTRESAPRAERTIGPAPEAPARVVAPLPPSKPQADPLRLRMASAYASSLPQMGTLAKRVETEIWKVSGGTLEIRFHEPGALVPAAEMFGAVSAGAIEAAFSSPGFWADRIKALTLFSAVPFGPPPDEYLAWMYFGGGIETYDEIYERHNIKSLPCGIVAPEAAGWFRTEIVAVQDLKGLRMRIGGLGARVLEKLGVTPVTLSADRILRAFESGAIDAAEFSMPAVDQSLGFEHMARYYYFPGWHQPATMFDLMINLETWRALTSTQKAQIESVCGDNIRQGLAEGEALQFQALKALGAKGVVVRRWAPAILKALESAWKTVVAEEIANDKEFARLWQSLVRFRADHAIWRELSSP